MSKDFPSDPVNLTLYLLLGINKYSSIFSFSVLSTYLQTICGKIVFKNHDGWNISNAETDRGYVTRNSDIVNLVF